MTERFMDRDENDLARRLARHDRFETKPGMRFVRLSDWTDDVLVLYVDSDCVVAWSYVDRERKTIPLDAWRMYYYPDLYDWGNVGHLVEQACETAEGDDAAFGLTKDGCGPNDFEACIYNGDRFGYTDLHAARPGVAVARLLLEVWES